MRNVVTYSICLKYKYDDINSKESQIHGTEKERERKKNLFFKRMTMNEDEGKHRITRHMT